MANGFVAYTFILIGFLNLPAGTVKFKMLISFRKSMNVTFLLLTRSLSVDRHTRGTRSSTECGTRTRETSSTSLRSGTVTWSRVSTRWWRLTAPPGRSTTTLTATTASTPWSPRPARLCTLWCTTRTRYLRMCHPTTLCTSTTSL